MARENQGAAQAAPTLAELAQQIRDLMEKGDRTALDHALEVGALLLQAKTQVKRGQWETWVKDNLGLPRVTSSLYMRLANNVQSVVHCKSVNEADRLLRKPTKLKQGRRKPREAGRRLRALHAQRRTRDSQLLQTRIQIVKLVGVLEGADLPELGVGDADEDTITEIHEELSIAAAWVEGSLDVVAAEMSDLKARERIRKLREDTNGRSSFEIETASKLADKLERKLARPAIAVA